MNGHIRAACARQEGPQQPCTPPQSCEAAAAQPGTCHPPPEQIVNKNVADKHSQK